MKKLWAGAVTALLAAGALALGAAPAQATEPDTCVPSDAWVETIEHPAVGEPKITIDNPDYVPESTTEEFDHWQSYSYNGPWESNTEAPPFPGDNWQANTASDPHDIDEAGAYFQSAGGSGKGDWFYLEAVTKTVTVPAQGEPTIEVDNPDYKPAWIEEIEHEAVVCPDPEPDPEPAVYSLTTSHAAQCGAVTITLKNDSPWLYRVLVEVKGDDGWERAPADEGNPAMMAPGVFGSDNRGKEPSSTVSYTVEFAEDSGDQKVRYRVSSGTESDLYVGLPVGEFTKVSVATDCASDPAPKAPVAPVASTTDELAATGGETSLGWLIGAGALLATGAGFMLRGKRA